MCHKMTHFDTLHDGWHPLAMRLSMNISLPAPLKAWVEQQVESRGYSTASEFVRDVLRREQAAAARSQVERHLLESMESGDAHPMDAKAWAKIRARASRRVVDAVRTLEPLSHSTAR